jgi:hypothetical protein
MRPLPLVPLGEGRGEGARETNQEEGRHDGVRMLDSTMLQPTRDRTKLEGDAQGC